MLKMFKYFGRKADILKIKVLFLAWRQEIVIRNSMKKVETLYFKNWFYIQYVPTPFSQLKKAKS